ALQQGNLARDPVRAERSEKIELRAARYLRAAVGQIDDRAVRNALDRRMGIVEETGQALGEPMIAPRLPARAVHALLHDDPLAVVGDDEAVQIKIEAVLDRGAVDLGDQAARARERVAVEAGALADRDEFLRGLARVFATAAAHVHAEFFCQ